MKCRSLTTPKSGRPSGVPLRGGHQVKGPVQTSLSPPERYIKVEWLEMLTPCRLTRLECLLVSVQISQMSLHRFWWIDPSSRSDDPRFRVETGRWRVSGNPWEDERLQE